MISYVIVMSYMHLSGIYGILCEMMFKSHELYVEVTSYVYACGNRNIYWIGCVKWVIMNGSTEYVNVDAC